MGQVAVLTTGGTIASLHGDAPMQSGSEFLQGVLGKAAGDVRLEDFGVHSSASMRRPVLRRLLRRLVDVCQDPDISGVVVTFGTDTLEEAAYAADLCLPLGKPTVFTGAMRMADAPGADGPANLWDALAVARSSDFADLGVCVVFSGAVLAARGVQKVFGHAPSAFATLDGVVIGRVQEGTPVRIASPVRRDSLMPLGRTLPDIPVVSMGLGSGSGLLRAAARRARGLVIAGTGGGHVPAAVVPAVAAAIRQGTVLVMCSRCPGGGILRVSHRSELELQELGVIFSDLAPVQARIKLMLALAATGNQDDVLRLFTEPPRAGG